MGQTVLLLNASLEPIRVISVFRAVVMVVQEKADILEQIEGKFMRSPSVEIPYPSVIQLRKYVKIPYTAKPTLTRKAILNRDRHECAYCGDKADTIDHIIPKAKGGEHSWMNTVAACRPCNAVKSDTLLEDLGWELRFYPTVPSQKSWVVIGFGEREQWQPYLNYL